jgi:alpha-galactosidase
MNPAETLFSGLARRGRASSADFCFLPVAGVKRMRGGAVAMLLLIAGWLAVPPCFAAAPSRANALSLRPPMGWNDWAHYQCGYTAQTILENARQLVSTGLASRGYKIVTVDDCWMLKTRDSDGNLQPDPERFPRGMKPVIQAVHALGLKFGS